MSRFSWFLQRSTLILLMFLPSLLFSEASGGVELRAGAVYRGGMEVRVSGGSRAEAFVPALRLGFNHVPSGPGPLNEYANREYADGYVRMDPGTGNPLTPDPNTTWHWGYDRPSQADGQALRFQSPGGRLRSVQTVETGPYQDDRDLSGMGVSFEAEMPLVRPHEQVDLGLGAGIRLFANQTRTLRGQPYRARVSDRSYSVVDGYDISAISLPPAPHRGTFDGPFDTPPVIPSPLIPNLPESREIQVNQTRSWELVSDVSIRAESQIAEFRLGPVLAVDLGNQIGLYVQPALTLGYLDVDLKRREVLREVGTREARVLQTWRDRSDDSAWLWGGSLEVGLDMRLSDALGLRGSFSGDWMESRSFGVGPDRVEFDVSGYTASLALVVHLGGGSETPPEFETLGIGEEP